MQNLPKENFNGNQLLTLLKDNKLNEAKQYVKQYFYKINDPVCCYFWDAPFNKFIQYTYEEVMKSKLTKALTYDVIVDKKVVQKRISTWFFEENFDFYRLAMKVNQPKVFQENGMNYINLFCGFKFETPRKPTKDEQKGINLVWKHVFEVLCSENQKAYELLKKLLCLIIAGRKVKVIIYFRSEEGAGKGILTSFIYNKVLGKNICYVTGKTDCLSGSFNAELVGKLLLAVEELRCSTPAEWLKMNEQLKTMATDPFIEIQEKYKTGYNIDNIISIIIHSNHQNAIKISKSDRRVFIVDVSSKYVGNAEYFDAMGKYTNSDSFAEAFYWDCVEYAKKYWDMNEEAELRQVETEAKQEIIIKNLHPIYRYIKDEYVLRKRDFDVFLKDLTTKFNQEYPKHELQAMEITKYLKEIGIEGKTSTHNRLRYKMSANELKELYEKKKFIHKTDEFEYDDDSKGVDMTDQEIHINMFLVSELRKAKKELENYKSLYEKLLNETPLTKILTKEIKEEKPKKKNNKKVIKQQCDDIEKELDNL